MLHKAVVFSGVFVITHIQSCRSGAGYCILGYSCDVDKDFILDDLGGNCDGLGQVSNVMKRFLRHKRWDKWAPRNSAQRHSS